MRNDSSSNDRQRPIGDTRVAVVGRRNEVTNKAKSNRASGWCQVVFGQNYLFFCFCLDDSTAAMLADHSRRACGAFWVIAVNFSVVFITRLMMVQFLFLGPDHEQTT